MLYCEVGKLRPVVPHVVQFEFEGSGRVWDRRAGNVPGRPQGDRTQHPTVMIETLHAKHLEILGRMRRGGSRAGFVEGVNHADAFDRFLLEAIHRVWRGADIFAAYLAYTDHEIGRVIQAVEDAGKLDNTLIIYISGDNGCSAEGTVLGTPNENAAYNGIDIPVADQSKFYDAWGSSMTYPHFAVGWSWAFDTPFRWMKQIPSFFGGTRNGMAISWPARIRDKGGIRDQFHHVVDIVPTLLEATGIPAPNTVDGFEQK